MYRCPETFYKFSNFFSVFAVRADDQALHIQVARQAEEM
jgi:hypothetical protein